MFRDDRQKAACCDALLRRLDLAALWVVRPGIGDTLGPTPAACELIDGGATRLSGGERAMLHLAFALWNGWEAGRMRDLLSLDAGNLEAVGSLLAAVARGPEAVDAWLEAGGKGR